MFVANIYGPLDGRMVILQLCSCKFLHKNFVANFIWLKSNFIKNTKNHFLSHPVGNLRVTYALIYSSLKSPWSTSYSSWLNFFRYLLRLRRYKRKSVKIGVFRIRWINPVWLQISDRRERRPPTTVSARKLEWLPFRMVSKYLQYVVWFCHKALAWQTYRRTDRKHTDRIATANTALA